MPLGADGLPVFHTSRRDVSRHSFAEPLRCGRPVDDLHLPVALLRRLSFSGLGLHSRGNFGTVRVHTLGCVMAAGLLRRRVSRLRSDWLKGRHMPALESSESCSEKYPDMQPHVSIGNKVLSAPPLILWPDPNGPFGSVEVFGWEWQPNMSVDENLLTLAYLIRKNRIFLSNFNVGACGAVFARVTCGDEQSGRTVVDILGLSVNAPPRFEPSGEDGRRRAARANVVAEVRPDNEIHAEMQVIARCARAGVPLRGAWAYISLPPCRKCSKAVIATSVDRIVIEDRRYLGFDRELQWQMAMKAANIEVVTVPRNEDMHAYEDQLWAAWRAQRCLDRAGIKALARDIL